MSLSLFWGQKVCCSVIYSKRRLFDGAAVTDRPKSAGRRAVSAFAKYRLTAGGKWRMIFP